MMKFTQLPLRVLRWPIQAGLLLTLTALGAGCGGTDTPPPVEESNPPVEGESPTPVPVTPSVIPATPTPTETPGVSPTAQVTPTPASPTDEPATPTATATAAPATPTSAPATPTLVPETPTVPPTPTATPSALDEDQDGSHPPQDCNDQDGTIYPGAAEIPYDGIDQDCADGDLNDLDKDGALGGTTGTDCDDQDPARAPGKSEIPYDDIDQDCTGADLVDVDGDGVPGGPNGQDCDDTNPAKSPNATEVPYDGIDQDCSGSDANDLDNDGYIGGTLGTDCDDTDGSVNPGKAEIPYDSVDQDCSGSDLTDQDKDGALGGSAGTDCDDLDPSRSPSFEEIPYNDIDDDCDGVDLTDVDEDGRDATEAGGNDCDDDDPTIYSGATEIPYDGIDQDCTGKDLNDVDADSYIGIPAGGNDCNDTNANVYPGAPEFADSLDNDCDGRIDEELSSTDDDLDGYSELTGDCNDANASIHPGATEQPYDGIDQDCSGADLTDQDSDGYAGGTSGPDCNDRDATINPGKTEVAYDGIDQDCSGSDLVDVDGDGYASTAVSGGTDCNDGAPLIHPGQTETCNNTDDDCDGQKDENASDAPVFYTDADGDTYGNASSPVRVCTASGNLVSNATDCNDAAATTYPGAPELCDGADNNCNSSIDEGVKATFYLDADGDGYGNPSKSTQACAAPEGYVTDNTDCKDSNDLINPGATEICNSVDDDCDAQIDEGVKSTWYQDSDRDSFGNPSVAQTTCNQPSGYVPDNTDCDDTNRLINPAAVEVCDGVDNNCVSGADENLTITGYTDRDNDSYGSTSSATAICPGTTGYVTRGGDCNDSSAAIYPGATETCNSVDDDCDSEIDEGVKQTWYLDLDEDGYGNPSKSTQACTQPTGYVSNGTDCKDNNDSIHPGATEFCNNVDDDCDGQVDDGALQTYYQDADHDGFGNPTQSQTSCTAVSGYVLSNTDCNDNNASINPNGTETCNRADDDCDGSTDEGVTTTYYADTDADGYGNPNSTTQACSVPTGYASNNTDCNDSSSSVNPGRSEICNGIDDNCNTQIDEGVKTTYYEDIDRDGYGNPSSSVQACSQPTGYVTNNTDCRDTNDAINPGKTELCNGIDDNCNNVVDDLDADRDGHRPTACGGDDCNDAEPNAYSGATEVCDDGIDNDCNGRDNNCYGTATFGTAKYHP